MKRAGDEKHVFFFTWPNFENAIVFNSVTYILSCTHLSEIETLQEKKN